MSDKDIIQHALLNKGKLKRRDYEIDLSGGPIVVEPQLDSFLDCNGSTIYGVNAPESWSTPVFLFERRRDRNKPFSESAFDLRRCTIISDDCGIDILHGGRATVIDNVRIRAKGEYGFRARKWDGGSIQKLHVEKCEGDGVVIDRMHIANTHITSRENKGYGIKAYGVRGGSHVWYTESNYEYGLDLLKCDYCTISNWGENNNRGLYTNPTVSSGSLMPQIRLEACRGLKIEGFNGLHNGQYISDVGSMYSCGLVKEIPPLNDYKELTSASDAGVNNWDQSFTIKPVLQDEYNPFSNSSIKLILPEGCLLSQTAKSDYWWPFNDDSDLIREKGTYYKYKIRYRIANQEAEEWYDSQMQQGKFNGLFQITIANMGVKTDPNDRGRSKPHAHRKGVWYETEVEGYLSKTTTRTPQVQINFLGVTQSNPRIVIELSDFSILWIAPLVFNFFHD